MLLLPAGILRFLSWEPIDDARFDPMDQAAWLAGSRDQVVPASGNMTRPQAEYPISQRIAPVMVEEQPAVKLLAPQRFLYSKYVHAIRE